VNPQPTLDSLHFALAALVAIVTAVAPIVTLWVKAKWGAESTEAKLARAFAAAIAAYGTPEQKVAVAAKAQDMGHDDHPLVAQATGPAGN